jgi:hypothetical protein
MLVAARPCTTCSFGVQPYDRPAAALAADVMTANGEVLRASAEHNADLLWAGAGGGGNFGVVTSFTYRLHPVGPVLAAACPTRGPGAGSLAAPP